MYGEPLKPNKTEFTIYENDDAMSGLCIGLSDMEDEDNDDVREVDHPDFDILFGNMMENVFEPMDQEYIDKEGRSDLKALTTRKEIKKWLLSIGMKESKEKEFNYGG